MDRVSVVVALAVEGLLAWRWWNRRSSSTQVAGPKRWPLIGSTLEVNWDRLHDWMLEQFSNNIRTFHLATVAIVSPLPSVYTVDPANVEHILKTNFANYPKVREVIKWLNRWVIDQLMGALICRASSTVSDCGSSSGWESSP